MQIEQIELFHIRMPLNFNFKTSQASIKWRETIVIKAMDELQNVGYGEVVSFNEPFYTNETLASSKKILINKYIKAVIRKDMDHPFDIHKDLDSSCPMAMSGLENALVDLYARRNKLSIMKLVFNEETNDEIYAGIVLGDLDIKMLLKQIDDYQKEGYTRFKMKIKPADGFEKLKAIRKIYPSIQLLVDANRSYNFNQINEIKKLDKFNLICIEEPLNSKDFLEHQKLQKEIITPICLDESIQTIKDLKSAIAANAFKVLNIKIGRVGGIYYAKQMIDLCRESNIKYWVGSMVESGISKILHVQLASLKDTSIPGDLSSSKRYFKKDIIKPEIIAQNGIIKVPKGYGLGVEIDEVTLSEYTIDYIKIGGE
ncbi:o-succinylbenzoate synthase [Clostridium estertheticum]|uniref:o-succinylbenzoate synthase n=1 Tax=Clostridium estertheticum TaxID=238834 RepID=UPI001C7DD6B0|nr:o-succinylbenzoate synthase [Clostridium estertheticum]MBX4270933.1 o-succinylbenzoate synthase [Clostridium estertheticum]WLC81166.1 o-succinylbenzoate synthase [Clostridium estertheticum]